MRGRVEAFGDVLPPATGKRTVSKSTVAVIVIIVGGGAAVIVGDSDGLDGRIVIAEHITLQTLISRSFGHFDRVVSCVLSVDGDNTGRLGG